MEIQNKQLQTHDIIFDVIYSQNLLNNNKLDEAYEYVKKFFFRNKNEIFFYDGITYELFNRTKAMELIPDDLNITEKKIVGDKIEKKVIKLNQFLKSTDFYSRDYKPVVDFSKPMIFESIKNIRGVDITFNYLNMIKQLPHNINNNNIEITKDIKKDLKLVYDHILNVLCSGDKKQFEYILNFTACSFGGRKLRKAIYWQSAERTGKGIYLNFLNSILGDRMHKTSSVESILKYTKPFEGCCLINCDERRQF